MNVETHRASGRPAMRGDVECLYGDVAAALHTTRDAVLARLDRGVRRTVLALSAVMVASAVVVVFAARLAS